MRREWIEICFAFSGSDCAVSPSMRREWIEMNRLASQKTVRECLPPCGGSGLKYLLAEGKAAGVRLPPCGGSGLKYKTNTKNTRLKRSPSMRREWIEIYSICWNCANFKSPSMRREWIEIYKKRYKNWFCKCLPPCGGSGLKYVETVHIAQ